MRVGFGQAGAGHPAAVIADRIPAGLPVDPADVGLLGAVVVLDVDHLKPPGVLQRRSQRPLLPPAGPWSINGAVDGAPRPWGSWGQLIGRPCVGSCWVPGGQPATRPGCGRRRSPRPRSPGRPGPPRPNCRWPPQAPGGSAGKGTFRPRPAWSAQPAPRVHSGQLLVGLRWAPARTPGVAGTTRTCRPAGLGRSPGWG